MPSEEIPTHDAVIIGGGLSGLTTAYLLRNKNILLLEKEARFDNLRVVPKAYLVDQICGLQPARLAEACAAIQAAIDC